MSRRTALLVVSSAVLGLCATGCTGGGSTAAPRPIPSGSVPTASQLIGAYASTLAHERFQFSSHNSLGAYVGTLDPKNDAADFSPTGADAGEFRLIGSHGWIRNTLGDSVPSQVWVVDPFKRDINSQLPAMIPTTAVMRGLDRGGTSPVQGIGAAVVHGAPTQGYEWSATLSTAETTLLKAPRDSRIQIQMQLDSQGRVCQVQLTQLPAVAPSAVTPSASAATPPASAPLDGTLTLYDFDTAPITAPPHPFTIKELNGQQ